MLNITLRQLQVFAAVARQLSYTAAAKELHLSQPGVSMQVKQLEETIGLPLFEKLGKRTYLTDAGRRMQEYAHSMAEIVDEAETVFEAMKGVERGRLSISVATTASHFATRLLAEFSKQHEGINLSLNITNREMLQRQLTANEPDLVIMGKPPEGLDVEAEAFMRNPLVMIAPVDHPLAGETGIALQHFADEAFVVREQGSGTRGAAQRVFDARAVPFNTAIEMTRNDAIKQAVEAGLGLGVVSIHTVELELEAKRLAILDVVDFPIIRNWYLVKRRGKRLSPAAEAFREFVLDGAERFIRLPAI